MKRILSCVLFLLTSRPSRELFRTSPRASVEILFTPLLLPELRPSLIDQRQMSASHLRHGAAELEDLPFSFHLPHTQLADQLHCVQAKSFQSERAVEVSLRPTPDMVERNFLKQMEVLTQCCQVLVSVFVTHITSFNPHNRPVDKYSPTHFSDENPEAQRG